jgi:hypothetical protein
MYGGALSINHIFNLKANLLLVIYQSIINKGYIYFDFKIPLEVPSLLI